MVHVNHDNKSSRYICKLSDWMVWKESDDMGGLSHDHEGGKTESGITN